MLPRLNYANAMATTAVFIALGGTSYAVTQLPRNSVGTAQLRNGAVTGAKLSVGARIAGPRGPRGAAGPAGSQGASGARGPAGAINVIVRRRDAPANVGFGAGGSASVITVVLPAGRWLVAASTNAIYFPNGAVSDIFRCGVYLNGVAGDTNKAVSVGSSGVGTDISIWQVVDKPAPTSVVLTCWHDNALPTGSDLPRFERSKIVAIPTDSIDLQDVSG